MTVSNDAEPARKTAVYRLYNATGTLIYIGASYDPDGRLADHKRKPWGPEIARRTIHWYPTREEALGVEGDSIATERPLYNEVGTPAHSVRRRADAAATPGKGRVTYEAYLMRLRISGQLRRFGYSDDRATAEGMLAERAYKEASGLFPNGVTYPPLDWIEERLHL